MKKYTYGGNIYTFIELGKMKNHITRDWIECVYYRDKFNRMYAREINDFFEKFTEFRTLQDDEQPE